MKQIGIYAGTFDPLHKGHIAFAEASIIKCNLDQVIFLPETQPRYKKNVASLDERIKNMTKELEHKPKLTVHQLNQLNFNVQSTLPVLKTSFSSAHLTLLVGSDVAINLHTWNHIDELLKNVSFAIGMRNTQNTNQVELAIKSLEKITKSSIDYTLIYTDEAATASSDYRNKNDL